MTIFGFLKSCLLITAISLTFYPQTVLAGSGKKLNRKSFLPELNSNRDDIYQFHFKSSLDDILEQGSATDRYDPLTIEALKRLKEDAQPPWHPEDIDPVRTRKAVEKAFAIETARHFSKVIHRSEIGPTYRSITRKMKTIQKLVRYSIQSDGDSVAVSRKNLGSKLLELNIEFNIKKGVDPQIRIGDMFRFRYDYTYDRSMFEYQVNF